jgi:hypothetical protein
MPGTYHRRLFFRRKIVEEDLEEREEDAGHDNLSDATAEIAPSTRDRIGRSDNFLGEHAGRPVLAHDKGPAGNPNEEAKDRETRGGIDQTGHCRGDSRRAQDAGHEDPGAVLVAQGSQDESHEDGAADANDGRRPNFRPRQLQGGSDLAQERGDGEPDEECVEEREPRTVEGPDVSSIRGTTREQRE